MKKSRALSQIDYTFAICLRLHRKVAVAIVAGDV
jgi:hypothetical protein